MFTIVTRVLHVLFGLAYCLLGTRLVLDFILARKDSGFYEIVRAASDPLYAPFRDIVQPTLVAVSHPVVWSLVIAMLAFSLGHAVLRWLLSLVIRES